MLSLNINNRYCKLTDGRIMVVWSDNTESETMHLYPIEDRYTFDAEWDIPTEVPYSDILVTDTNLAVVEHYNK